MQLNRKTTSLALMATLITGTLVPAAKAQQATSFDASNQAHALAFCAGIAEVMPRGAKADFDSHQVADMALKALSAEYNDDAFARLDQYKALAQQTLDQRVDEFNAGLILAEQTWQQHCQALFTEARDMQPRYFIL